MSEQPRSAAERCMGVVTQHARISKAKVRGYARERVDAVSATPRDARPPAADRFPLRSKLRDAWVEFLGRVTWHVFATLTYRRPTGEEVLIRNIERWLWLWQLQTAVERGQARLADDGGHDPFKPKPSGDSYPRRARGAWPNAYRHGRCFPHWVAGVEPQKSGRLHAHVLIHWSDRLNGLRRTDGWRLWFEQYGFAKLEEPRSGLDVAAYCTKYVVKGGDLYLSPSFDACKPLRREPFVAADLVRRFLRDDRTPSRPTAGGATACPPVA